MHDRRFVDPAEESDGEALGLRVGINDDDIRFAGRAQILRVGDACGKRGHSREEAVRTTTDIDMSVPLQGTAWKNCRDMVCSSGAKSRQSSLPSADNNITARGRHRRMRLFAKCEIRQTGFVTDERATGEAKQGQCRLQCGSPAPRNAVRCKDFSLRASRSVPVQALGWTSMKPGSTSRATETVPSTFRRRRWSRCSPAADRRGAARSETSRRIDPRGASDATGEGRRWCSRRLK